MYLLLVLAGLVLVGLVVWTVAAQRGKHAARKAALEQLGFRPCPEQQRWLEETVARIENNRGFRYEVRDPKRLSGEPAVYFYVKRRDRDTGEDAIAEEEILFPLTIRSAAGLVLTVKPSSLAPGLATRMLGAIATGPRDAQPDDLQSLEIPMDLKDTNWGRPLAGRVRASTISSTPPRSASCRAWETPEECSCSFGTAGARSRAPARRYPFG